MVQADYLFLMTDVDCLYTSNPRRDPSAKPIQIVADIRSLQVDVSTSGSSLGTGGMSTKIVAARLATSAGVTTIITKSSKPGNVSEILKFLEESKGNPVSADAQGEEVTQSIVPLHTRFLPSMTPVQSRSFWLLHGLTTHGAIYIDHGAYAALLNKAGLLPAGVVAVEGQFSQQEAVKVYVVDRKQPTALNGDFPSQSDEPKEVGRALVSYGSTEISLIKGFRSTQIQSILGYADSEYIALRQNISFYHDTLSRPETPSDS
jgi:glutamate 5-kinase